MQNKIHDFGKRILGLDVGLRRIGLALSDPLGITAQGIKTLVRTSMRADLAHLTRIAREYEVDLFVAGNPLHMSGDESRQGGIVREFAGKLEERSGIPVQLWDERLTTVQANRVLLDSGISQNKRARAIDQLSAVLILQSFLDSLPAKILPGEESWPDDAEQN